MFLLQAVAYTEVKTLSLLYLFKINGLFLRQINKRRRNTKVWWLSPTNAVCVRSPEHVFNSEGFCGSLNSLVKSKVRLRNTAHPFNSLLWLYPTSEAIKNVFIEGRGETLRLSWDCRAANEVINMRTNMTAMYDESQMTRDVVLS